MKKNILLIALALGMTLGHAPAPLAQNTDLYIGLGLEKTSLSNLDNLTPENQPISDLIHSPVSGFKSSQNGTDNRSWMIYGGYQLNRFLAIEALYTPIGEYSRWDSGHSMSISGTSSRNNTPVKNVLSDYKTMDSLKLDGFGLTALANLPIYRRFSVIGRCGTFRWSGKLNHATTFYNSVVTLNPVNSTDKGSGFSPLLGLGGIYEFKHGFSLRAEWLRIKSVGGNLSTGKSQVNISSIGAQIKF